MRNSDLQPALEATKAVDYLRQHTDEILTTAQLARAVHISEQTLNRKIKQAFGVAPYELMLRIRVQAAAETLLQTSKEISKSRSPMDSLISARSHNISGNEWG